MAPFWHLLFPPAAQLSTADHPVISTAISCAGSQQKKQISASTVSRLPKMSSTDTEQEGCCRSSESQQPNCSCREDTPAQSTRPIEGKAEAEQVAGADIVPGSRGTILYASQQGTAASYAQQLAASAASTGLFFLVQDVAQYEVEQMWKERCVILVLSTYEDGAPPSSARCAICQKQRKEWTAVSSEIMLLDVLNNAQNTSFQTWGTCDFRVWTTCCHVASGAWSAHSAKRLPLQVVLSVAGGEQQGLQGGC